VTAEADRAVVIYDGLCPLCQESVSWLSGRARRGALEFLPCQAAERRARFPWLEEQRCIEAIQLVLPDGRALSGAAAVPEILKRLRRWRWLAAAFRMPGMGLLAPRAYAWIARRRYRISAVLGLGRHHRAR
jgi:predicted DCC family thiol-disulfide oxidoreductase YuxK